MEKVIGRIEEKALLERAFKSKNAEFIAVYGRRRVGKTFLVREFFSSKQCVFFHITGIQNGNLSDQLYEFTRIIESTFYQSQLQLKDPTSWTKAFELLTNTINQQSLKKVVLFFDELPWLATQKSGFLQALDYYWNRFWVNMPALKLVVCGSAASWIIENILHHTGGLHNRVTLKLPLNPFNLFETKEYLKSKGFSYTDRQISDVYMVMGGIPFYLNFIHSNLSVPQNIDRLCFTKKGPLVEEFQILYSSLFQNFEAHQEIIKLLGQKRQGIEKTNLLKMCKLSSDGGTFNKRIQELETSDFIASFVPYGHKQRNTSLRLIDEYSLFYQAWIAPSLPSIKRIEKPSGYWVEHAQSPSWKSWSGYAFEALCFKHIEQIRKALGIHPGSWVGNWKYAPEKGSEEEGAQIDLLFDRNDGVITICEIKYTNTPYKLTKQEAHNLLKKVDVFKKRTKTNKQVMIAMITATPLQENMYSQEIVGSNVTLKDLFGE